MVCRGNSTHSVVLKFRLRQPARKRATNESGSFASLRHLCRLRMYVLHRFSFAEHEDIQYLQYSHSLNYEQSNEPPFVSPSGRLPKGNSRPRQSPQSGSYDQPRIVQQELFHGIFTLVISTLLILLFEYLRYGKQNKTNTKSCEHRAWNISYKETNSHSG